jgi:predicted ester cyclase
VDSERNKANTRRVFEEGFSQGRLEVVDECLAPDGVDRHEMPEGNFRDHLKAVIGMLRGALPDLAMTVEDLVGEGDRVAVRVVMTGTHTGDEFFGLPAVGNSVRVEQFHIIQFDDAGRGLVHWAAVGEEQLLNQLRRAPVPT